MSISPFLYGPHPAFIVLLELFIVWRRSLDSQCNSPNRVRTNLKSLKTLNTLHPIIRCEQTVSPKLGFPHHSADKGSVIPDMRCVRCISCVNSEHWDPCRRTPLHFNQTHWMSCEYLPVFTGCGCTWHRRSILMHSSSLSFLAADRTSRLWVFKEVHLPCTSFLEAILETIYGLSVNILLWQCIPSIDDPLGKEVQTWIAVTMLLHQFPSVPSGWSVFGLFEKMWPRSGRQSFHQFE